MSGSSLLPFPVSSSTHKSRRFSQYSRAAGDGGRVSLRLASQYAQVVFLVLFALSFLLNIRFYLSSAEIDVGLPLSIEKTLQAPKQRLRHLVMVPGHAIWTGCDAAQALENDDWILQPIQLDGDVKTLVKHITKGAEIAVNDPEALLVFSGGQTRPNSDLTEASSYARLAKAGSIYQKLDKYDQHLETFTRVTTEEFALDSFENLLFSIARFREFTGHYPDHITIVGYGMKRQRFQDVHRAALRYPDDRFTYVGIDNEINVENDYEGERKGGLQPYLKDIYGCNGELMAKRRERNIYRRVHPYHQSAPELYDLFEYCPSDNEIFNGDLPWN